MKVLALLALLAGCATTGTTLTPVGLDRTGEEAAVHIVWHDVYGREDVPPTVHWKEGAALECDDHDSGKRGFWIISWDPASPDSKPQVVCREGDTQTPFDIVVSWHGELSFSETALAHELQHAELLRRGIFLGHHDRPDFFTRIDAANAALVAAGR